jgi:hypothetical protein
MGNLISRLLFQPPDPPSYKDEKHIIWLESDMPTDSKSAKKNKKKRNSNNIFQSNNSEDEDGSPMGQQQSTSSSSSSTNFDEDTVNAIGNGKIRIPCVFLEYKGSDLCLLYSHGNATDMGQMMPYLELLRSSLKVCVCVCHFV